MSRKKKAMRAFLFQNPDATRVECWDAAWANEQSRVSSLKHQELERLLNNWVAWAEQELPPGMGCLLSESRAALKDTNNED